ncbi:MAG: glycosyltransferase family 2 protein [Halanaerobiaceae bacterium]
MDEALDFVISNNSISVIIPAYNEEDFINTTLDGLPQHWFNEIIVINDGSFDKTGENINNYIEKNNQNKNKAQFKIITFSRNRGKGYSVLRGIKESSGDIIVLLDADLGASVVEVKKLLAALHKNAEASIGVIPVKGGGLGLVCKLADTGLKFLTGKSMKAPLSGQRAFKRKTLLSLLPLPAGFGLEMGLNIKMIKNGVKYVEVECDFQHRTTVKDLKGFIHRGKQFFQILNTLLKIR